MKKINTINKNRLGNFKYIDKCGRYLKSYNTIQGFMIDVNHKNIKYVISLFKYLDIDYLKETEELSVKHYVLLFFRGFLFNEIEIWSFHKSESLSELFELYRRDDYTKEDCKNFLDEYLDDVKNNP